MSHVHPHSTQALQVLGGNTNKFIDENLDNDKYSFTYFFTISLIFSKYKYGTNFQMLQKADRDEEIYNTKMSSSIKNNDLRFVIAREFSLFLNKK